MPSAFSSVRVEVCLTGRRRAPGLGERDDAGGEPLAPPPLRVIAAGHFSVRHGVSLRLERGAKAAIRLEEIRTGAAERRVILERANVQHEPNVLLRRGLHELSEPLEGRVVRCVGATPKRAALRPYVAEQIWSRE